jgi:hypothetical protein
MSALGKFGEIHLEIKFIAQSRNANSSMSAARKKEGFVGVVVAILEGFP